MTPTERYLIPHSIFGEFSFDTYCASIPNFFFKHNVPPEVVKNFEVIEKLMALSYYEYKFIDEAYSKAILTFEMAMSIRAKDFNILTPKDTFHTLITKLNELKLFDSHFSSLENLKQIRNIYAHPRTQTFGGTVFWNRIEHISF